MKKSSQVIARLVLAAASLAAVSGVQAQSCMGCDNRDRISVVSLGVHYRF